MSDPLIDELAHEFAAAMSTFRDHIEEHWPAHDDRDLDEANLVLQLAIRLAARGVRVYQEVYNPATGGTLDLYAIDTSRRWALALEAKRIKGDADARSLGQQAVRLAGLRMPSGAARVRAPRDFRCFTALVAHCWDRPRVPVVDPLSAWWLDTNRSATPELPSVSDAAWSDLRSFLSSSRPWTADLTVKAGHGALFAVAENTLGSFWP